MAIQKLSLVVLLCLNLLFSGCSFQGVSQNPNEPNPAGDLELTGTALAVSGALETPDFTLFTPTAAVVTPSPIVTPVFMPQYPLAVVMVKEEEVLNVLANPNQADHVIATLPPHTTQISTTGKSQEVEGEVWVEIQTPENGTGWVKMVNLTEQVSSMAFCSDKKATALVGEFMGAVQVRDGQKLAQLVSPRRGLIIRHEWWNPEVHFQGSLVLENIFTDSTVFDWGINNGSGQTIQASFKDEILPLIDDVQGGSVQVCNSLEQGLASGGSTGFIRWPGEYANINYIAIYRPAVEGDELNWRTWAIGIEDVNGNPTIAILVQYHWEI
ncbi:MAG: SH3 domain-containing protein [Anaerolineaceae bacterium]